MGREDDLLLRVREVWCYCFPGLRPGGHPSPKPGLAQDTASWESPGLRPGPGRGLWTPGRSEPGSRGAHWELPYPQA